MLKTATIRPFLSQSAMRDRTERFSSFPFSVGCVSQSSVEVIENQPKKSPNHASRSQIQPSSKMRSSFGLLPLPKPNISAGLQKVIKGFKSLSNIFQLYGEEEEVEEIEMEIGLPTDVQHVAHIGWEGFNSGSSVGGMKSWNKGPDILSLPSLSLRQFELSMAAQAGDGGGPY